MAVTFWGVLKRFGVYPNFSVSFFFFFRLAFLGADFDELNSLAFFLCFFVKEKGVGGRRMGKEMGKCRILGGSLSLCLLFFFLLVTLKYTGDLLETCFALW